ncbi:hypothetical protein BD324DRAFT_651225 [Kockovaella imperatae]|uniref:Kinesin motor domain-containing protein n=1 Tax=Kockovaella imperatae TaxID=4999 RepID=A0A1Y1UF97_9TREE|nr:hypothetical protein BD324DRAFT_651225 [Kockovaella imperatae]ORX36741.1 hypothetical protein BD324DRAFT_651225 [Kockovaella imperatae]
MTLNRRRSSFASPLPLPSPGGSAIPRPSSATGHRMRRDSSEDAPSPSDAEQRNVRVVLRIRPSDPDDASVPPRFRQTLVHPTTSTDIRVDVDPATLAGHAVTSSAAGVKRHPTFTFDHVLGENANQVDLYDVTAKDVVGEFLKGHNVTFLAYGQTSSGKSYSMGTTGEDADYTGIEWNERTGLIPRTVQAIFDQAESVRSDAGPGSTFELRLSFLELYNEEIIDLLSGSGVSIAIREERDGRIVWSGVREIKVKDLAEVMQLLYEGSARRKTGETGMNATSSRSHAIFSLTLVQKKRATTSLTASSSLPVSSEFGARSLKRPSSTLGFASSRSPTPSGSRPPPSSYQKSTGISRPQSVMGIPPSSSEGEFLVITSKFNMVDLAGSERLKRTAAQGDRMKEGISINSGLLALGNVISHLGDPIKSKGHIPYRDSKLTRMLQDSIGGNSLTTMIACISPIEYNVAETINTLKYASRARNIRNTSKANAVEAGWDDVEHLQATVVKLRKQLANLDSDEGRAIHKDAGKGNEKLIQRLADLQREHTELYDRYLAKCSESMRLTSELKNAKPGDADALAKFNETVEPVIIEYEKVVSALNRQLDGLRAELTSINELYEEQSAQLKEAQAENANNEANVSELRGRVAKLTERNDASEVYVQDLEGRLKTQTEQQDSNSAAVVDLRKEIAKLKELNDQLNIHTTELEARLAKAETRGSSLEAQIELQEKAAVQRENAYKDLEKHIEVLDTMHDNKLLLEELETKDQRVSELEIQCATLASDVKEEQTRLIGALEAEKAIQGQLRSHISKSSSDTSLHLKDLSSVSASNVKEALGEGELPTHLDRDGRHANASITESADATAEGSDEIARLRRALEDLAARCHAAESRFREAEDKVIDLTSQLSEATLIRAEIDDVMPLSPAPLTPGTVGDRSEAGSQIQTPKRTSESPSPTRNTPLRRSSVPTLSSLSVIQKRDFRSTRGLADLKRSRPLSLSQELSSAQPLLSASRMSWTGSRDSLLGASPTKSPLSRSPRSSESLEKELKFLHKVVEERDAELKDREAYIAQLERNAHDSAQPPADHHTQNDAESAQASPHIRIVPLTPVQSSRKELAENSEVSPAADSQDRIDALIKEMKDKEQSHREIIDQQFIQIADLQKTNHKLKEDLYREPSETMTTLLQLRQERDDLLAERSNRARTPDSPSREISRALEAARGQHAEELEGLLQSHKETIDNLRRDHEAAIEDLRTALGNARQEHQEEVDGAREAHQMQIEDLIKKHADAVSQLAADQEAIVGELERSLSSGEEQRRQLKMKADQSLFELSRIRDEHAFQRNADLRQIAELQKVNTELERVRTELDSANSELQKRASDLESRYSTRKAGLPPPQGPPPSAPLPPLPASALPSPVFRSPGSSDGDASTSTHRSSGSTALTSIQEIGAAMAQMPDNIGQVVQKVVAERDTAVSERESLRVQLRAENARLQEADKQLQSEKVKTEDLSKELHESKKTSSKLRAHLEDARQDTKRVTAECSAHMDELNQHRSRMAKLSEESGHNRDSLMAANAQVASLRAQLDRAVETKVNKKLNQRMKCF